MSSTSSRFLKPLNEFINSKSDFSLIYSTSSQFISNTTKRICVLDSSFNPPHKGHYTLIDESLKYYNKTTSTSTSTSINDLSILLLLSIKNVDKSNQQPESFDKRLDMIYFMTKDLESKYNQKINISIGLTTHAKFVDKSLSVSKYLNSLNFEGVKISFLIGFDTLIRIFNPKYYLPDKLSNSLENFMKFTDLFCLTRFDETLTNELQSEYINDIKIGLNKEIPSHWSDNIHLIQNDSFATISSSNIRNDIKLNNQIWEDKVIPEIKNYIIENNLYKN